MDSIITKVEVQKKNKDRVNIYINHEFAFGCSVELIYMHNITKDRVVKKEDLENIINEDNYIKAKSAALHCLEKSFKSHKQVVDKLLEKEFDITTIDRVMEFLKQYNFVDDHRFIELFIKEKIKSSGENKIKFALLKKGLPEELIKERLSKVTKQEQFHVALQLGEKKINILCKSEKDIKKLYKKTSDYLVRNGYDFGIVSEVLDRIISNMENEESVDEQIPCHNYEKDYEDLQELASKRYNILIKSGNDKAKIYKKLGDYLLRRSYPWEQIKKVLKDLINYGEET